MKKDITSLFCLVDDFVAGINEEVKKRLLTDREPLRKPTRTPGLNESEIITVLLMFQRSPCTNFKYFYHSYLQWYRAEFPRLPSYERFVTLMPRVLPLLVMLLYSLLGSRKGTGIAYIDSTALAVCHPKRISRNKVFKGIAALGKSSKGWFLGLKLHVIIDEKGNLLRVRITKGNTDDRAIVDGMTEGLGGLLFGDKGYICKKLFLRLLAKGIRLITGIKKTMKNILMGYREKLLLRKRSIIETVFDYLKNKMRLEHTRHRSPVNAFIHIITTLITYQLKPTKPSISGNGFLPNP